MATIVETYWGPKSIDDTPYWHLVKGPWLFYHNVRLGKGAIFSISAVIETDPCITNAQTPYSSNRINDAKEMIFEKIRRNKFPNHPPRLKIFYVFDDSSLANRALIEWFPNENRIIHECRIIPGAIIHKVDAALLNASTDQWAKNAERYWKGEMTEQPFPEVLVHGGLYFPDWESFSNSL